MMTTSETVLSCCFKCGKRICRDKKDGGDESNYNVDVKSSIKSPCLCCVTTREIHIDLKDNNAVEEETPPPRKRRREITSRILSIWKSRRASKQPEKTSGNCEHHHQQQQRQAATPPETPFDLSGGGRGVFEQAALLHGASQGEEETVSKEEDSRAYPETSNLRGPS